MSQSAPVSPRDGACPAVDGKPSAKHRLAYAFWQLVPRGAIADHITFDGKPIFFPGSMDYDKQGQPWGYYPCLTTTFSLYTAWQLINQGNRLDILDAVIEGMTLLDRLDLAFVAPSADADTQLVYCDEEKRGVSFGFTDIVVHTGYLLFCSPCAMLQNSWLRCISCAAGSSRPRRMMRLPNLPRPAFGRPCP